MLKENKSTSRRNRRQCSEADKETAVPSVRDPLKTVIGSRRYGPFPREIPKGSLKTKQGSDMMMPSIEVLHSVSEGIIESGIKYILFPLHLLRFCIFGPSTKSIAPEEPAASTSKRDGAEKDEKKTKEGEEERKRPKEVASVKSSEKSGRSKFDRNLMDENEDVTKGKRLKERNSDKDESTDEMLTAEDDSDSSNEQWSNANNMMAMNVSIDYNNLNRTMSYTALGEPMDISMEEQPFDKTHISPNLSRNYRMTEQFQNNKENLFSKLNIDEQDSNSSVDEEIAKIFQKQCTFSEDEYSSSSCVKPSSFKREKTRRNNFPYYKVNYNTSMVSIHSKKQPPNNAKEQKKKQPPDFSINSKRRKVSHEEDKNRKNERRTENKIHEENRNSRHDTPSKRESRASRTPMKNKETKRKDVKYKEIATQTDSAFSDDDVEMIPIDVKHCNKRTSRRLHFNLFEDKDMERELNYVADTEDSNDGSSKTERKRISSCSTSSSSTDLGFDERALTTPDMDIIIGRSRANSLDNTHNFGTRSRPPPGFPELPQNPPLMPYIGNSAKHFIATHPNHNCPNCSIVPPAPSPMRHLYYDYPEFMDLPVNVNSSKILNNILRNYYR